MKVLSGKILTDSAIDAIVNNTEATIDKSCLPASLCNQLWKRPVCN